MNRFFLIVVAFGVIVPLVTWVKITYFTNSSTSTPVRTIFPRFVAYFEVMLAMVAFVVCSVNRYFYE